MTPPNLNWTLFTGSQGADQPSRQEEGRSEEAGEENERRLGVCEESSQPEKVTTFFIFTVFFP